MSQAEILGSVILALGTLIGLYCTVCKPMLSNQKVMTELTCAIKELNDKLLKLESNNSESHRRLYKKFDEHTEALNDHELRLHDLETRER
ncbi:MAG: hypothetical protein PHO71_21990 [Bacteroides sp.]|nr:hypothetical protein [Bacteroides sp.]